MKEDANLKDVNLAYTIQDGQKIYIPSEKDEEDKNIITTGSLGMKDENKKTIININKATQTELEVLPGVGPSTAGSIINYRKEHGKFNTIDDIKNVSGIGEAKFEKIKEYICV